MSPLGQLTDRQQAVYDFIQDKITRRGYGPTVREIGEQFRISSPNGVMCHLKALERKGLIRRSPNKSRAIELTREALEEHRGLPLAGQVAAGRLTLAEEQTERIDFAEWFNRSNLFVLRVTGDSMIDAQIADGDFVIVRKQATARAGDMVVARTGEGNATLKYWHPEANRVRLQPANPRMKPIYATDVSVVGIVVGVVRKLRP
jgi:repressor LexA